MTSKEALIQLVGNAIAGSKVDVDVANWLEDIIEKDLEVLELLKPIIKSCFVLDKNLFKCGELHASIETNKIIKEWLEK